MGDVKGTSFFAAVEGKLRQQKELVQKDGVGTRRKLSLLLGLYPMSLTFMQDGSKLALLFSLEIMCFSDLLSPGKNRADQSQTRNRKASQSGE